MLLVAVTEPNINKIFQIMNLRTVIMVSVIYFSNALLTEVMINVYLS
jgi:hypothetical protein